MLKKMCLLLGMIFLTACSQTTNTSSMLQELPPIVKGSLNTGLPENEGLFLIEQDEKFGLIDVNGDIVFEPKYTDADFKNSTLIANYKNDGYIILNNGSEIKLPYTKNQYVSFDTSEYILYYMDKKTLSFVSYVSGDVKTMKIPGHLENLDEIVYMNDYFFVSSQNVESTKTYFVNDYLGNKVGETYIKYFGHSKEKPMKIALGDAENVYVFNENFEIQNTFSGIGFNFITNENFILYKNQKEIQYIDSSGTVLNTYPSEFNIATDVFKPHNFVCIKAENDRVLTNIFGKVIIDRGFANIEPSSYNGELVFMCRETTSGGRSLCSIYDINGQLIKTLRFLQDYDILLFNDEYAAVKSFESGVAGIIDPLTSTETNIKWLAPVENGNIEIFNDIRDNPIEHHFLITKDTSSGIKYVGLYNAAKRDYVFTQMYSSIKSIGNGLYNLESIYYRGVSTYDGDFRYLYEIEK
ncbi:MAG: hypothetical protein LBV08_03135 [Clostridiales bacterium]|jgi:hypothetical protein|nr:hypothetical protein [Clostridiales bacterium]